MEWSGIPRPGEPQDSSVATDIAGTVAHSDVKFAVIGLCGSLAALGAALWALLKQPSR